MTPPKYEALWPPESRKTQGRISKPMVAVLVKDTREHTHFLQDLCLLWKCLPHWLEKKVQRRWEYLHVTVFSESTQTNSKVKEISGKWMLLRSLRKSHQFLCVMEKKIPETHIRKAVLWTGKIKRQQSQGHAFKAVLLPVPRAASGQGFPDLTGP